MRIAIITELFNMRTSRNKLLLTTHDDSLEEDVQLSGYRIFRTTESLLSKTTDIQGTREKLTPAERSCEPTS